MELMEAATNGNRACQRRRFPRHDIQCRARIVIGQRHYAGYLHNISRGGAKLRTVTRIRKLGEVLLKLPDMPPLRCRLCWKDPHNAGVAFELLLSDALLGRWIRSRSAGDNEGEIAELESAR